MTLAPHNLGFAMRALRQKVLDHTPPDEPPDASTSEVTLRITWDEATLIIGLIDGAMQAILDAHMLFDHGAMQ